MDAMMTKNETFAARVEQARQENRVSLRDLGFTLTATERNFEVTHTSGTGAGWSGDYHHDVAGTVRTYLQGVEAGISLGRRGIEVKTSSDRYEDAMAHAGAIYADVVDAFKAAGFPDTYVTQTGGMCLAIEVPIGTTHHALVTAYEDILPWEREELTGWACFVYENAVVEAEGYTEDQIEVYVVEDIDPAPMIAALVAYRTKEGL